MKCQHEPFKKNTLIVESHWGAGVRVRCRACGRLAGVQKHGRVTPEITTNRQIADMEATK